MPMRRSPRAEYSWMRRAWASLRGGRPRTWWGPRGQRVLCSTRAPPWITTQQAAELWGTVVALQTQI